MFNILKKLKGLIITFILAVFIVMLLLIGYLKGLPTLISNQSFINFVESKIETMLNAELKINKPVLKTSISPRLEFSVENIELTKDNAKLLDIKNTKFILCYKGIFKKHLIIKELGSDKIYANISDILSILPKPETKQKSTNLDWNIDIWNSLLYIKNCKIIYDLNKDTILTFEGKNIDLDTSKKVRYLHFDFLTNIKKNDFDMTFKGQDENKIYIKDKAIFVDNFKLDINNSALFINAKADKKNNFNINVSSKNFNLKDVTDIINSNLIISNGKELLSYTTKFDGDFDFNATLNNKGLDGKITVNKAFVNLVPLADLPVTIEKGYINFDDKTVTLKDFSGYYSASKSNSIKMDGTINDYIQTMKMDAIVDAQVTNDFVKNHLSKLVLYPIELSGEGFVRILYNSVGQNMDFTLLGKLPKGSNFLVDNQEMSPADYDRAAKVEMNLQGNKFTIKDASYYMGKELTANSGAKPLLSANAIMDITKLPSFEQIGFKIPKPLPSEFLNMLAHQRIFRKGLVSGEMQVINKDGKMYLDGTLAMDKVFIPSQRLFIKSGTFKTHDNLMAINADGRYRRTPYSFNCDIENNLSSFPVVVKDINLTLDDLNIEKILKSFAYQAKMDEEQKAKILASTENSINDDIDEESDEPVVFDPTIITIEKGTLKVKKGSYKDILFGNLNADLTLDKNGVLQVKSNRFDIAEGISSAKVYCDLLKQNYRLTLGVKDIDSNMMATTLLNLPREISGKASGIIDLHTDSSLMMNGKMKFIVKDGIIQKIGLVEYAMTFASVFRNPLAMLSPSLIFDLTNIPDGKFDKITGDISIKNNNVEWMKIKSYASQLSAYIVGTYNITTADASMRIYTKFSNKNKGFTGFLRKISLNSLASRLPFSSKRADNYYASELDEIPQIDADENDCQIFITRVEGDVSQNNFLSSLRKIK